jgi:hypothetical protein
VTGNRDPAHISTSFVEGSNLTIKMNMRRLTKLTKRLLKETGKHRHAFAIFTLHYNFCGVHQTFRVMPAMEAGLAGHIWEIDELVALID